MVPSNIDVIDVKKLQYVIFSGKREENLNNPYYELVFNFWKAGWKDVFQELNTEIKINENDFYRQNRITAIVYDEVKVISINLLADYHIDDFFKYSYFHDYTIGFYQFLKSESVKTFQCLQFLLVDPEWSSRKTGIRFGATTLSLSLKNQQQNGLDATLTLARDDVPSTSTLKKLGMETQGIGVEMHNAPVSQMYCKTSKPYHNDEVNVLSDYLWRNRKVFKNSELLKTQDRRSYDQPRARI